ncbi:MAG: CXXX repeat peptide maturase [Prevotella sp.]|nr:CXXX repeat peptide maturase [Prevotella sp.]
MLTHIIILLDDTSVSYCHYDNTDVGRRLIAFDDLNTGIVWAMKENLNIQFVYPDYALPDEYNETIETIDHTKIKPDVQPKDSDVIVLTDWKNRLPPAINGATCIIRTSRKELDDCHDKIVEVLNRAERLNIVLTDIDLYTDKDADVYKAFLDKLADDVSKMYSQGKAAQVNLLTDRIMLSEMNNCNAGSGNVTLAPNGKFYLCPAFYYNHPQNDVGNLKEGLRIKNQQLLRFDHAPICRHCDAYQCRRCVWMNSRLTMDANTPSHQQCVVAHLERNASRLLQHKLKEKGISLNPSHEITMIDYLDPFNIVNKWK